jgi:murein DD-endopeptidase MepM/ murein hydrolase activator NlpD
VPQLGEFLEGILMQYFVCFLAFVLSAMSTSVEANSLTAASSGVTQDAAALDSKSATLIWLRSRVQELEREVERLDRNSGDLSQADNDSKIVFLELLDKVQLDPREHPEIARALGDIGELTVREQIARRKEIADSVPTLRPCKTAEAYLSSDFGERQISFSPTKQFHKGIDLAGAIGTPIYAPADGIVRYAKAFGRFGNYISIVHGLGLMTKYAHIDETLVKPGQVVRRGEKIATMGRTGRVTGTHLHYEIWLNDQAVDPTRFMIETPETQKESISVAGAQVEDSAP